MKGIGLLRITFLFLVTNTVYGQDHSYFNRTLSDFASRMQFSGSGMISQRAVVVQTVVEGSVYMNKEFKEGEIFTSDNVRFTGIPMRYDAYHSEFEVLMPDNKIWCLAKTDDIVKISLDSSVLVYTRFVSPEGEKSGYLSLIYNGMSTLYRRDYKVFKEGVPSKGIINEIPPQIVDRPKEYYIRIGGGLPSFIKTKKDLSESLKSQSPKIDLFLRREKINVNKEADLIKVLTYFDSIN